MIIYLYVKQHTVTKLKYFGVTRKPNPFTYRGSGRYWQRHISKHGANFIKTLEVWGFDDPELCREFAVKFSLENNIVESDEWANLVIEDTIVRYSGGSAAHSASAKAMWDSDEYRAKQTESHKRSWENDTYRVYQSEVRKNNWQDPAYVAKTKAANKESRKCPQYLASKRTRSLAQWSCSEFRQKRAEARASRPKKIWITNGQTSKTWPVNEDMPDGYYRGRH